MNELLAILPLMRVRIGSWAAIMVGASVLLSVACGGNVSPAPYDDPRKPSGGTGGGVGGALVGGGPSGGQASGGFPDLIGVGGNYEDLNCPDLPPIENYTCDPLIPGECGDGYKCSPYIVFPDEGQCEAVQYGSYCAYAGVGEQGDACSTNGDYCGDGFLCVVGTGSGARCARVCDVSTGSGCPVGLFCGETDAQNLGVCY
jgi:hypothetical protein